MNKEQQIEEIENQIAEMAKLMTEGARPAMEDAEALYNAGYRKVSEVTEDIFSDFESILFSLMYLDFDGKYHLRKMNGDRVTKIFERYCNIKKKYTKSEKDK